MNITFKLFSVLVLSSCLFFWKLKKNDQEHVSFKLCFLTVAIKIFDLIPSATTPPQNRRCEVTAQVSLKI